MNLNKLQVELTNGGRGTPEKFEYFIELLRTKYNKLTFTKIRSYRYIIKGGDKKRMDCIEDLISIYQGELQFHIHSNYTEIQENGEQITYTKKWFQLTLN